MELGSDLRPYRGDRCSDLIEFMHPNGEKIIELNRLYTSGDVEAGNSALKAMYADDVVTHIPGRRATAGDYYGFAAFVASIEDLVEKSSGTFKQDLHAVLADDEHSCELYERSAVIDGVTHQWKSVDISNWRDGKIVEQWLIPVDAYQVDEIFGQMSRP